MVVGEVNATASDVATNAVATLFDNLPWLSNFIRAVGIFVIVYAIYLLIKVFRDVRMRNRIKEINGRLVKIEEKIDSLIDKKSKNPSIGKTRGKKKSSKKN